MPGTLTFSGARYPTTPEGGDVPADLLRFGSDIDENLVLKATSQANRDTLYANVEAGTLVSCAALKTVWQKLTTPPTAASWATLAEIGTAVTAGVGTGRSGFTISSQWAQRINGIIYWRASLMWNGATQTAGSTGNLTADLLAFSLTAPYLPTPSATDWPIVVEATLTTGAGEVKSNGDVYITSISSNATIVDGQTVKIGTSYPGV